ncbi:MAG: hypothetical protein HYT93_00240 [Parcubacteria group bacterium]|nr:hypothetical protein [Parcubacteria group bacterium]
MPYVPSEKTTPPAEDRTVLDPAVNAVAEKIAKNVTNNFSLLQEYKRVFMAISAGIVYFVLGGKKNSENPHPEYLLAYTIFNVAEKYGYEGAFLGELNYAITRLIQRVPQVMVKNGTWKDTDELRYWLYACTASALRYAATHTEDLNLGIDGVFEDIKDEYKWRVNRPYEIAQILKSGDCYDAPYYSRVIEVVDEDGKLIGHQEIMLKRSDETLKIDLLPLQIVVKKKK